MLKLALRTPLNLRSSSHVFNQPADCRGNSIFDILRKRRWNPVPKICSTAFVATFGLYAAGRNVIKNVVAVASYPYQPMPRFIPLLEFMRQSTTGSPLSPIKSNSPPKLTTWIGAQ